MQRAETEPQIVTKGADVRPNVQREWGPARGYARCGPPPVGLLSEGCLRLLCDRVPCF